MFVVVLLLLDCSSSFVCVGMFVDVGCWVVCRCCVGFEADSFVLNVCLCVLCFVV